ncbi:hypothetical protein Aperf_G00000107833 [Anoplocephala perfoliata]
MEDWISLLSLDSQTSSQIISEDCLRRIAEDLKEGDPLSKENFETTSLASNLRTLGDYDSQAQLLEFLLRVIPSARRRSFAERYIHPELADPFCDIIGQNFDFLQSTIESPSRNNFWVDFNLVPERITTYCVLTGRASQSSFNSEDQNEQMWETISIYAELIEEVNVSSILAPDEVGTSNERINLSISTSASANDYARFWESDASPCYTPKESRATIEFCLVPNDVVNTLPRKAPMIQSAKEGQVEIQSQQQQLIGLIVGLRAYAEKMLTSTPTDSSQSPFIVSQEPFQQRPPTDFKSKATFASCNSPLSVRLDHVTNSQSAVSLPPTPKPKSFFADPDISFEESFEGFGVRIPTPKTLPTRSKPHVKHQTACTPLSLHVGPERSGTGRKRSGSLKGANTCPNRSVSPPFSVASGLETPTPIGSSKTLEGPKPWKINYGSPDEDIASVSLNNFSATGCGDVTIDEDGDQSVINLTPQSPNSVGQGLTEPQMNSTTIITPVPTEEKSSKNYHYTDVDPVGDSQSTAEKPLPQVSGRKRKRDPKELASASPATEEIPQKQNSRNGDETSASQSEVGSSLSPVSLSKDAKRCCGRLASEVNISPIVKKAPINGDKMDFNKPTEASESSLQTFENFVKENKLELTNRRRRRLRVDSSLEGSLIEEITTSLGPGAKKPFPRLKGRPKKSTNVNEVEEQKQEKNKDDEVLAGSSDIMRSVQVSLMEIPTPPAVEVNPSQVDPLSEIRVSPERARSANLSSEELRTPISVSAIPSPVIEEESLFETKVFTPSKAPTDEDKDVFASPSQPPPRRRSRSATRTRQSDLSTTTTTVATVEDSQSTNKTNPSPMVMSPFLRLEAAVNALETSENKTKAKATDLQGFLKSSKMLCDITASYLIDQSPCPNAEGELSKEEKAPPPGGLIVPAFGNEYFNITSKRALARKAAAHVEEKVTKPKRSRRFFPSTFAERNKREVEKRFFEVAGEEAEPSTPRTGANQDDSLGRGNCDLERFSLDQSREQNDSGRKLQSRPAMRRAARIARQKILGTSIRRSSSTTSAPTTSASTRRPPRTASTKPDTPPSIEKPRGDLNHSDFSLFAPTPNNSAIFDFTLSEDDELVSGLPRPGKGRTRPAKKITMRNVILPSLKDGRQPIISAGFLADMGQCISIFFSTLELAAKSIEKSRGADATSFEMVSTTAFRRLADTSTGTPQDSSYS